MSHLEKTMNRIFSHHWEQQPLKLSHIRLVEEFRYLVTLWLDVTGIERSRRSLDSFNLPMLFEVMQADIEEETYVVQRHIKGAGMPLKVFVTISVLWAYGEDIGLIPKFALPDPYEPILVLYERGGNILHHTDNVRRYFVIADNEKGFLMPQAFWPKDEDEPLPSLDRSHLDEIDEEPLPPGVANSW